MDFLDSIAAPVWFAMAGALATKLLELAELHKVAQAERPDFKDIFYWVPFAVLPLLGGGLTHAYLSSDAVLTPLLAVNIGISAPLILRSMVQAIPEAPVSTPEGA